MKYKDRGGSEHTYGFETAVCYAQRKPYRKNKSTLWWKRSLSTMDVVTLS